MTDRALLRRAREQAAMVAASGLTIYDPLDDHPELFYELPVLQARFEEQLSGATFAGPPRTRSLLAKRAVAEALGHPAPRSFQRVRPRFPAQNLDVAVQQADNFQVWNEEVDPLRRYAFLRPDRRGTIVGIRVVTGEVIAALDRTGTLTSKYQAKRRSGRAGSALVVPTDTSSVVSLVGKQRTLDRALRAMSSADLPERGGVLPIAEVYRRLRGLEGQMIVDPGAVQDRLRGEAFQSVVSDSLGIGRYQNLGQWPDLPAQALEVKLQTKGTIDLGLILPSSSEPAELLGHDLRHSDIRYAIAYADQVDAKTVRVESVVVSTGEAFFKEFQQFGGLEINRKLQIRLPRDFFKAE